MGYRRFYPIFLLSYFSPSPVGFYARAVIFPRRDTQIVFSVFSGLCVETTGEAPRIYDIKSSKYESSYSPKIKLIDMSLLFFRINFEQV